MIHTIGDHPLWVGSMLERARARQLRRRRVARVLQRCGEVALRVVIWVPIYLIVLAAWCGVLLLIWGRLPQ